MSAQMFSQEKWSDIWCDTWNMLDFDGMRFEETVITRNYRLKQDTVIGNQTYRQFSKRVSVRFSEDRKVYVYYEGFDDNDPYTPDLPTGEYLAYDFSAQVGDTLEVFSGLDTYSTYPCVVDSVAIDSRTKLRTITLHKICRIDGGGFVVEFDDMQMTWIEGVGSSVGFLFSYLPCGYVGGPSYQLLCAYRGDELKYTGPLYEEYGCGDNSAAQKWADMWCDSWNVMEYDMGMGEKNRETWIHYLAQDTIINGQTYTCVMKRSTLDETRISRYAFVRFSEDKKVYALINNTEYLVYDFSVQVGDTITTIVGANWGTKLQLLHVTDIKVDNETNRKSIILYLLCQTEDSEEIYNECCPTEWIEGVGDIQGFLMGYPICDQWVGGVGHSLLCAHKDDELKYYDPTYYDTYGCEYNTATAVEEIPASEYDAQKLIQDDQLLILHNGQTYNVMGVEIRQ